MLYNHLSKYLLREGYNSDPICPCVFIKKSEFDFFIIVVYVDDLNIIGTYKDTNDSKLFKERV
jgi:hypothetical protein